MEGKEAQLLHGWVDHYFAGARMIRRFGLACVLVLGAMSIMPHHLPAARAQELEREVGRHACKWIWDCTRGRCRHIPQCADSYDLIPPEPLELPPLSPIDNGAYMTPDVLPTGGSHCPPRRTCDQIGECVWEVRC